MRSRISWRHVVMLFALSCFVSGFGMKPSFGNIPTYNIPLFEVLNKEITKFKGGVNITLTFRNYGYDATSGTVWIPWEDVWYGTSLTGSPPSGNIMEAILPFDINGDGDTSDVFTVEYLDNKTVLVDATSAYAMNIPEQRIPYDKGVWEVFEKNNFTLGSKTHTMYHVVYYPEWGYGYAGFGLDAFFHYHPSPNIKFAIEHVGASISSAATAWITHMELNGVAIPYEFNMVSPWFDNGQWYVDNAYVYPLGSLASDAVFTVKVTVTGSPGAYLFQTILNWAPDTLHRYRFLVFDALDIPFAITGTVHRDITFENKTYYIDIVTNSTISPTIAFNSTAKEISFNATVYSNYGAPATYFWNVSIPQNFLTDDPWRVALGDNPVLFTSTNNGTHNFLYFNYTFKEDWFTTSKISIKGTWAVPESNSNALLSLLMTATLTVALLYKRKQSRTLKNKQRHKRYLF